MGSQPKIASRRPWSVDLQCCIIDPQCSRWEITTKRILLGSEAPQNFRKSEHKVDAISYNGKKFHIWNLLDCGLQDVVWEVQQWLYHDRKAENPVAKNGWQGFPESCWSLVYAAVLEKLDLMPATLTRLMDMLGRVRVLGDSWCSQVDSHN